MPSRVLTKQVGLCLCVHTCMVSDPGVMFPQTMCVEFCSKVASQTLVVYLHINCINPVVVVVVDIVMLLCCLL